MIAFNLSRAGVAMVDVSDADLLDLNLYPVEGKTVTYVQVRLLEGGHGQMKYKLLHRLIMERVLGRSLNSKEFVDHIDRNGLNNCRSNLRLCTQKENMRNRKGRSGTVAGLKGVSFQSGNRKKCWIAYIFVEGKQKRLGGFYTPEEAHETYKQAAVKYFGEFARFE